MVTATIQLPAEFGWALLSAVALAVECLIFGFVFPGRIRNKVFGKSFMNDNFGKLHTEHFKSDVSPQGYPDMGSGFYSQKLSYREWYVFNNAQRAHQNFVEGIATYILLILVSAISHPLQAAILGGVIFVGRLIFGIGYVSGGPKGRLIGALLVDFALLGLIGLSGHSCWKIIQRK